MQQHILHNIRQLLAISLLLILSSATAAQPHYGQILQYAEKHNPTLLAAAKRAEAEKATAHVGALIPNPEIGTAYYWGDPAEVGIRWDMHVSQTFEMPSVLIRKARLRNLQEHAAELNYQVVRNATLLEIQQMCADWVYYHAITAIYTRRCQTAARLADLYKKRFASGDCSVLDYNRAQMHLADMQTMTTDAMLKEDHAVHDIRMLVGGDDYPAIPIEYETTIVESSFQSWYEQLEMRNPTLQLLSNQVETNNQQLQLTRSQWLPTMNVGYASENHTGESFRGITLGLELPLWSQQRAVRAARLQGEASQQELNAQRKRLEEHLYCMFHRHEMLIHNVKNLRDALRQYDSQTYLERALEAGEISLEQYLQQSDFYQKIELQIWETAHELEQLHLILYAVEL
ncbi:MAG: TolC family protein [Bacteroidales bacterium]|nr:TolC family protein [Bacteroidales bacterium]